MYKKRILFAGNPNVGKSTIFNTLTGSKQHTGNWAGKTVEMSAGKYKYKDELYEVYDLPGTYSLVTSSMEEEVAIKSIVEKDVDVIVVICNAVLLERSLNLAIQILDIMSNVIVVVNLMDEAKKKGITINLEQLSLELGVPVIGCSAINNDGIVELKEEIRNYDKKENVIKEDVSFLDSINRCHEISRKVISRKENKYIKRERKLDRILTNKITGIPIMLLLLFLIFYLTIIGSNYPSELLSKWLFSLEEPLYNFLSFLPSNINGLLVHGMYKTTAWVVSVMLPPMLIFFPLFTILEDIGLLPRIAFNLDPLFAKCNSCGKQALTMCMGIGCNAVGVTGCRIFESKKARMLAIITNSFMPCNGRYPTLIAIITMFLVSNRGMVSSFVCALILVLLILLSIIITFVVNKILSKFIYKDDNASFVLELSDYRKVKIGKLIVRSIFDRTLFVLGRALAVAAPCGVIIYLITNIDINSVSVLEILSNFLNPVGKIMGLDGVILLSFILGFPANEIVMPIMLMTYLGNSTLTNYDSLSSLKTILVDNGWSITTSISFLVFTLFHFPCSTTLLTIKKETDSWFITFLSFVLPLVIGFVLCIIINIII